MGEHHPAERKICLEFCTADLLTPNGPLKSSQRNKLIKLLGVRYNPSTDLAKMSCEKFETQAQNKRYLGDLVDSLIKEAQDKTDTFNDLPFDYRHHKAKSKPTFPAQWRMTEARQRQLESQRQERLAAKKGEKLLIDGMALLEGHVTMVRMKEAREAEERVRAETARMGARDAVRVGRQPARA
jgi:small subunit ribosomal protein S35